MTSTTSTPRVRTAPPKASGRGRRPMSDQWRGRQRLMISRAAIRLFRDRGVTETSVEQIAEVVGLSARTLFRYFRSKESCVEPVLSVSVDAFVATLRRWPAELSLEEHLVADHRSSDDAEAAADSEAALAVIGMSREEPALRAIWLVVYERAEPVLAEVLADHLDRPASDIAVRVQAAALSAALRITSEDLAASLIDGTGPIEPAERLARLSAAVHAATHGVLGAGAADRPTTDPTSGE